MDKAEMEVKKRLHKAIGKKPRDDIWERLVRTNWVGEFFDGSRPIEKLAEEYRDLDNLGPSRRPSVTKKEIPPDLKSKALAEILAFRAARDEDVIWFRKKVLRNRLLRIERAGFWIERQAKREGVDARTTAWLEGATVLPYHIGGHTRFISPPPVGTLAKLERYSDWLHERVNGTWTKADAVDFILTGEAPKLPLAMLKTTWFQNIPALSRISLSLDPRLSPRDVQELYSAARRSFWGKETKRDRGMEEKGCALAVWAEEQAINSDDSLENLRQQWNAHVKKEHPDWTYSSGWTFSRDLRSAWNRITGQNFNETRKRNQISSKGESHGE